MDASGRNHNAVIATRWDCGVCGAIWMRLSTAVLSCPRPAMRSRLIRHVVVGGGPQTQPRTEASAMARQQVAISSAQALRPGSLGATAELDPRDRLKLERGRCRSPCCDRVVLRAGAPTRVMGLRSQLELGGCPEGLAAGGRASSGTGIYSSAPRTTHTRRPACAALTSLGFVVLILIVVGLATRSSRPSTHRRASASGSAAPQTRSAP
jgi:hypothetical protein